MREEGPVSTGLKIRSPPSRFGWRRCRANAPMRPPVDVIVRITDRISQRSTANPGTGCPDEPRVITLGGVSIGTSRCLYMWMGFPDERSK